jgi:protein subunit release factor A
MYRHVATVVRGSYDSSGIMKIDLKDVVIETMTGSGPGGRNRNSREHCVRATHKPSGVSVKIDGRNQSHNKREALKLLQERVDAIAARIAAAKKKAIRDSAIKNNETVRTYNYKRQEVVDHRTKKRASLKKVLEEGMIDLLFQDS